jgi:antitoxin VapB
MVERYIHFLPFRIMSLNIKSSEADRLVTEVARLTGESKTQAVIESLRQRLDREQRQANQQRLKEELLMILRRRHRIPRRIAL